MKTNATIELPFENRFPTKQTFSGHSDEGSKFYRRSVCCWDSETFWIVVVVVLCWFVFHAKIAQGELPIMIAMQYVGRPLRETKEQTEKYSSLAN